MPPCQNTTLLPAASAMPAPCSSMMTKFMLASICGYQTVRLKRESRLPLPALVGT